MSKKVVANVQGFAMGWILCSSVGTKAQLKKLKVEIMNKKLNSVPSDGTKVEKSTNAEPFSVSQPIAKPNVGCSATFFCRLKHEIKSLLTFVEEKENSLMILVAFVGCLSICLAILGLVVVFVVDNLK